MTTDTLQTLAERLLLLANPFMGAEGITDAERQDIIAAARHLHGADYTFTIEQMAHLMQYVVHRADCQAVIHRLDPAPTCTCGLFKAIEPVRVGDQQQPATERLATNRDVFAGRSIPAWLAELIPARHRAVRHGNRYRPGPMSDG